MDFVWLAIAVCVSSFIMAVLVLIVLLNIGVLPKPEAEDPVWVRKLYWRKA